MRGLLKTQDLRKYFGAVRAVDGVSISVDEGEFVSLVGPNGSGKTTLLNLISGLLKPDRGRVIFMGRDVTGLPPYKRARLGMARSFQITTVFEGLSVLDNVRVAVASVRGYGRKALRSIDKLEELTEEAMSVLKLFNLDDEAQKMPKELPQGRRKLLDVAIAFSLRPKLMLLDEPTAGVSTREKMEIMELLRKVLKDKKVAAMIVEHDMDVVYSYSDRVMVMNKGRIIASGKPNDVAADPLVREVLLGG